MSKESISQQEKLKLKEEKKESLDCIINYFKLSKDIGSLIALLNSTKGNTERVTGYNNVDALVVLTSDALEASSGSGIIDSYCSYKGIETKDGITQDTYQIIEPSADRTYKIAQDTWKTHITNKYKGQIQSTTNLATVLDAIISYVNDPQRKTKDDFKGFLTKIKNSIKGGIPGMNGEDKDAAKIITDAIKDSPKKCVIFTGAPGTGKTYCVEEFVDEQMNGTKKESGEQPKKVFDRSEYFVQFHSSYDYTDFVEGLRPIQKGDQMVFVRMDGIFKAFCRKVVALNEQDREKGTGGGKKYYFVIDEINRADLGRVFGELMYCFEKRGKRMTTQYANLPAYGKNGDGKIVPIKKGDNSEEGFYITDRRTGAVQKIVPIKSNKDDYLEDSFYIIKDKDGNPIPIEEDCFENGFYIPNNVVIIGTMNDIDRSVETFDFALRRRFDWIEIDANNVMFLSLKNMQKKGVLTGDVTDDLVKQIKEMNKVIADDDGKYNLGPAFAIGPAYFAGYGKKSLNDIWLQNIKPILQEYMRGRGEKKTTEFVTECENKLFNKVKNKNKNEGENEDENGEQ